MGRTDLAKALGQFTPKLPFVIGSVAELLGPDADPAQEAVGRVLGGERDAAEHLHGAVRDLTRAAGHVRLGDRRGLGGLRITGVEGRGRVADRGPPALLPDIGISQDVAQGLEAPAGTSLVLACSTVQPEPGSTSATPIASWLETAAAIPAGSDPACGASARRTAALPRKGTEAR